MLYYYQGLTCDFIKMGKTDKTNTLTEKEDLALKGLGEDDNIVITKADKGNAVVILNKKDYHDKLLNLLSDETKFDCIESDLTIIRENKLKNILTNLVKNNTITKEIFNKIRPVGSRPGIIYGLPKIHKPNYPLRPIISSSGTYNYNLVKLLDELIKPLLSDSKYILKDTFDFINIVSKLPSAGVKMVSFDVVSLFTNIPLLETIEIIVKRAFKDNSTFHGFKKKDFVKLLKIATQQSHFHHLGLHFDQIDGVAMGSPLAPTFANFFMDEFETIHMEEFTNLGVKIWHRYVDDTFVLMEKYCDTEKLLTIMNSKHKNIKFTIENEVNKKIPFLDVLIRRQTEGFHTSVYHKPTFTGVYLNWFSLTSKVYKIGLIKCLLGRTWRICSDYESIHKEFTQINEVLKRNGYPEDVIDCEIKKFLDKKFVHQELSDTIVIDDEEITKKLFLVLPYINDSVEELGQKLVNLTKKYYPKVKLRVLFKSPSTISNSFSFKEKTPKMLQSNLVYSINCAECNDFYVGKTSRCLIRRINEHKTGLGTEEYKSALFKHSRSTGHRIDYENVTILDTASSDNKLLLKEMLHINRLKPTLNKQKNSALFSLIIGAG